MAQGRLSFVRLKHEGAQHLCGPRCCRRSATQLALLSFAPRRLLRSAHLEPRRLPQIRPSIPVPSSVSIHTGCVQGSSRLAGCGLSLQQIFPSFEPRRHELYNASISAIEDQTYLLRCFILQGQVSVLFSRTCDRGGRLIVRSAFHIPFASMLRVQLEIAIRTPSYSLL